MNQITSWLYPNQFDLTTVMSTLALLIGASVVIVVLARVRVCARGVAPTTHRSMRMARRLEGKPEAP
jgi:hypothetical protein